MTTTEKVTVRIKCAAVDSTVIREHLELSIEPLRADGSFARISQRTVRGMDAVSLAQITIQIAVEVDVGQILVGIAALLAAARATVFLPNRQARILNEEDVTLLVAEQKPPQLMGPVPKDDAQIEHK